MSKKVKRITAKQTQLKGVNSINKFADLLESSYAQNSKFKRKVGIKLTDEEQQRHYNDLFRE